MPKSRGHINAIGADRLGHLQHDVDLADLTGHFHQIVIYQAQFLGCFGIHPQTRFILVFVEQLVILGSKLGMLADFTGQQVELIRLRIGRFFPGRPG